MDGATYLSTGSHAGVFQQAETVVQDACHATVGNPVSDADAIAAAGKNAQIRKALELIAHRLGLHVNGLGQLRNGEIPRARERVQEPKARVIGENAKECFKAARLFGGQ
jgi:hypothetical protein